MKIYEEISKSYEQVCSENRNEHGYIELDELLPNGFCENSREAIGNEEKTKNWIMLNGVPYLYKGQYCASIEDSGYAYAELVVCELARQVGIEAADYDLAQFDGEYGIITKNVAGKGQDMFSLVSFLGEENDSCNLNELLENFEQILAAQKEQNKEGLKDEFIRRRIFDLFIIATDTHTENISMIFEKDETTGDKLLFSPLYDNESALIMDHTRWQMQYILEHKNEKESKGYIANLEPTISCDEGWPESLRILLSYPAGLEFAKKCYSELNMDGAIASVERKIGCAIPKNIKEAAQFAFDARKKQIENCLLRHKVVDVANENVNKFRRNLLKCYDENGYKKVSMEPYEF